jgi:hypothetical protein
MAGGAARESPVPVVFHCALLKAVMTSRPSNPLAVRFESVELTYKYAFHSPPVTRTEFCVISYY